MEYKTTRQVFRIGLKLKFDNRFLSGTRACTRFPQATRREIRNGTPMKMLFAGLVIGSILVFGCKGEKGKTSTTMANPSIDFQSGISGAERFLNLPGPILSAKWCEFPRGVSPSRLAVGPSEGPTDTVLLAVLELVSGSWPKWEQAMDSTSEVDMYYLPEALATGLLPPEWLATLPKDSIGQGRRLLGEFFNPSPIAKSPYLGAAAIRHGNHLFLELGSK